MQFTLQFDVENLKFERIEPLAPGMTLENFGINRVKEGLITVSYSADQFESALDLPLFKVVFQESKSPALATLPRLRDWP